VTLSKNMGHYLRNNLCKKDWEHGSEGLKHLLSKSEYPSSNPNIAKKKEFISHLLLLTSSPTIMTHGKSSTSYPTSSQLWVVTILLSKGSVSLR
jgi:hypothetical protein